MVNLIINRCKYFSKWETKLATLLVCCLFIVVILVNDVFALDNPFASNRETSTPTIAQDWYFESGNFYYNSECLQEIRSNTLVNINTEVINELLGTLYKLSNENASITAKSELIAELFSHIPKEMAEKIIKDNKTFLLSGNWSVIDDCIYDITRDFNAISNKTDDSTFKYFITVQNNVTNEINFLIFTFSNDYITNINII